MIMDDDTVEAQECYFEDLGAENEVQLDPVDDNNHNDDDDDDDNTEGFAVIFDALG